jgi:hypothetical protein
MRSRHFILLAFAIALAVPTMAGSIHAVPVSINSAIDIGPQDGIVDVFAGPINVGSVNNNGYTSYRTAFEFNLSGIPLGAILNNAQVTMGLQVCEGVRTVKVDGYIGDGIVQLTDFLPSEEVGSTTVDATTDPSWCVFPQRAWVFDVTSYVANVLAAGEAIVGFNVREEARPPSSPNYTIMHVSNPMLSVTFTAEYVVDIDIKPGRVPNSVNPLANGNIPVAILSTEVFDAFNEVDSSSLTFGRTGDEPSLLFCNREPEDVNADGLGDWICHFDTLAAGFLLGDTQGVLKGQTGTGDQIKGTDSVRPVK